MVRANGAVTVADDLSDLSRYTSTDPTAANSSFNSDASWITSLYALHRTCVDDIYIGLVQQTHVNQCSQIDRFGFTFSGT